MTDCKDEQLEFQVLGRRQVVAAFNGGSVTSDAGGLLIRETIQGSKIIDSLAKGFVDHRDPELTTHSVRDLLMQRLVGLALGYEDLNDHDHLRNDALFSVVVGKADRSGPVQLAGKSTLNRLELTKNDDGRTKRICHVPHKIASELTEVGLDGLAVEGKPPKEIWLDLDATDNPIHGSQQGKHFNKYYDHDCFLPLYFVAGHELLVARLRTSDCNPMEGVIEDLERVVRQIRDRWPDVRIYVRGDSAFSTDELMVWCEDHGVDYVFGFAKNARLERMIEDELAEAKRMFEESGKAARVFADLRYQTLDTWTRERRVVAKAEQIDGKSNPRFVVTSISKKENDARELYEDVYCARGEMENRIKEQQMGFFSDRTSCHPFIANQLRLWLSAFAYAIVQRMRAIGLKGTELEKAQAWSIREKLFKIGATITFSVRRVVFAMSSSYPWQAVFVRCLANLQKHYVSG
jgi:hypothetical protein